MKALPVEAIVGEMGEAGFRIDPDFLAAGDVEAAILDQVDLLLDLVPPQGLKLTAKGNLPTKVVKQIALCCPSPSEAAYLTVAKRFIEEDYVAVMRARYVSELGGLVKVDKGMMYPGIMLEAYRHAPRSHQYIYLLDRYGQINLGYFDRMQETEFVDSLSYAMMQVLRDREAMHREVEVYVALLENVFGGIAEMIEEEIVGESLLSPDPLDAFVDLVDARLFQNTYLPFGLVTEQGPNYEEEHTYCKTDLLDRMLLPMDRIDTSVLLTKKHWHHLSQRIRQEGLEVDLFYDFGFIYAGFARYPLESADLVVEEIMRHARIIGTKARAQEQFYRDLIYAATQTFRYFTQLETKGGGSIAERMSREFQSMVDGLYRLLPRTTPYALTESMRPALFFLFDVLRLVYEVDIGSGTFLAKCEERFGGEVAKDIAAAAYLLSELEKKAKKSKRINAKIETMAKDTLSAYILAVMSIHTYEADGEG